MLSLSNPSFSLKQLPTVVSARPISSTRFSFFSLIDHPQRISLGFHFSGSYQLRARVRELARAALWEDPDNDSESDYEYEEEDEGEEGEESCSDLEAGRDSSMLENSINGISDSNYEEELVKEVELLLGPEERATLQQNGTPLMDRILTEKWNPIHTLALAGQMQFMDQLLGNGLNVDMVDKDGRTALHYAVIGKREAVISHLLRKGANPQARDLDGATPLHYAVQVGAMQTVKLLIKCNVDVNIADNEGWTALHVAVQSRNRNIVKVLLVNGADKSRRNKDGNTALDLSLCYGKDFKSYYLAKLVKLVPAESAPIFG
nr:ankyrin repeat domain-containing protein EMB506, chloroplastic [Ipomoea batatas]